MKQPLTFAPPSATLIPPRTSLHTLTSSSFSPTSHHPHPIPIIFQPSSFNHQSNIPTKQPWSNPPKAAPRTQPARKTTPTKVSHPLLHPSALIPPSQPSHHPSLHLPTPPISFPLQPLPAATNHPHASRPRLGRKEIRRRKSEPGETAWHEREDHRRRPRHVRKDHWVSHSPRVARLPRGANVHNANSKKVPEKFSN